MCIYDGWTPPRAGKNYCDLEPPLRKQRQSTVTEIAEAL